jgi:hypothetical protein
VIENSWGIFFADAEKYLSGGPKNLELALGTKEKGESLRRGQLFGQVVRA